MQCPISRSSNLFIVCFFVLKQARFYMKFCGFCTRDVLSQKWPSSNPPSPATFRNLCYRFLMPWHLAEGFLLETITRVKNVK